MNGCRRGDAFWTVEDWGRDRCGVGQAVCGGVADPGFRGPC
jgi:hypothetical protein